MNITTQVASRPGLVAFRTDILTGLRQPQKALPSKYLYDERGSALFERITELHEYYLTRTETAIMEAHGNAMAQFLGPGCLLIEYGSGSSTKTRILLDALVEPAGYIPIDISEEHLLRSVDQLQREYSDLPVFPVVADFTGAFVLPEVDRPIRRRVVYFPGSTIGNFHVEEACQLLTQTASLVGSGGAVLLGVDLQKKQAIVEPAYNDAEGVTAAFNRNLLRRINRELDADFDLDGFAHLAPYNPEHDRIEMYLVSLRDQTVRIGQERFHFRAGEHILTEYSYKYRLERFAKLAHGAGFEVGHVWTDDRGWFSVQLLIVPSKGSGS